MKRHYFLRLAQPRQWDVHQYYLSAGFSRAAGKEHLLTKKLFREKRHTTAAHSISRGTYAEYDPSGRFSFAWYNFASNKKIIFREKCH